MMKTQANVGIDKAEKNIVNANGTRQSIVKWDKVKDLMMTNRWNLKNLP
jgi:hypothetical protein